LQKISIIFENEYFIFENLDIIFENLEIIFEKLAYIHQNCPYIHLTSTYETGRLQKAKKAISPPSQSYQESHVETLQ